MMIYSPILVINVLSRLLLLPLALLLLGALALVRPEGDLDAPRRLHLLPLVQLVGVLDGLDLGLHLLLP